MSRRHAAAVVAVAGALSLVLPAALTFDAWAWLVWGREVAHLDLDTTGGPSWKPLPVMVTTVLSPLGDLAPALWLLLVRIAALFGVVLTYRLAARFAGWPAGVIAAALLWLTLQPDPRFLLLVAEGHSAPVAMTLTLWAVERHLDGRRHHALVLGVGAALLRPEAWLFLGLYAAWLWRSEPGRRGLVAALLPAIPLLWFGGDWWGSGDPWHGAGKATVAPGDAIDRLRMAAGRVAEVVGVPAWVAAGAGISWWREQRAPLLMAAGAAGWLGLVVAMATVLGYAALSRFLLPAGALVCVLAGIGTVGLVRLVPRGWTGIAAGAALAATAVALTVPRALAVGGMADRIVDQSRLLADLDTALEQAIDRTGGRESLLACGQVAIDPDGLLRPALAWRLELPLSQVADRLTPPPASPVPPGVLMFARTRAGGPPAGTAALGRSARWVVYAAACPADGAVQRVA